MSTPSKLNALIDRINNELDRIEKETTESLTLARAILDRFPGNNVLIQMFAFLNNVIFLLNMERERVNTIIESLSLSDQISPEEIQMAGEDLSNKLGILLETRLRVNNIKNCLENLQ